MTIEVREARSDELVGGTALLARSLRFGERDAIPGWLVHDLTQCGAIALAAVAAGDLAGFSLAVPALGDDGPYLFSCGLAVRHDVRGRGIGRRLKLAQADIARTRGHRVIRWRADPLNAAGLRLYLDGLGARLVGYRSALYAGVRDDGPVPHDDVDIEWRLDGAASALGHESARVEIPSGDGLRRRLSVRDGMRAQLDSGGVGVGVERDAATGRVWVRFEGGR